ncbi:MAG: rRNA pseudouridine synthase [Bacteroidales bacterium]|nr:rRNA pseudouridine synthase [Bacteroidales bacterium]
MGQRIGKSRPQKVRGNAKKEGDKKGNYSKFYKKDVKKSDSSTENKPRPAAAPAPNKKQKSEYSGFDKDDYMRLNKYIAKSGICSRREADKLIETGVITVNGKLVAELGFKVHRSDRVVLDGQLLTAEKLHYILLNKPKGFITTTDDPQERRTVMGLIEKATDDRVYPVGRLDMKTTGLLLFTNDGDIAKKLTHPKHRVRKVYQIGLDRALTKSDMQKIIDGLTLEDGEIIVDKIAYVEGHDNKKEIGIQIHSGRNRIVRRIFEHLGYEVVRLDRVVFAGLTKKDLPRGKWRWLSAKEVDFLKMI